MRRFWKQQDYSEPLGIYKKGEWQYRVWCWNIWIPFFGDTINNCLRKKEMNKYGRVFAISWKKGTNIISIPRKWKIIKELNS